MPEVHSTKIARQPFTVGGVVRFAHASFARLLLLATVFGLISGIAVAWLFATCIAPVVDEGITRLPETGSLAEGRLLWPNTDGGLLAANAFVSFEVVLQGSAIESAPVDFAFQLRSDDWALRSMFGTQRFYYPPGELELNRTALSPAWGAWRGPALVALIPGTALSLLLSWGLFGIAYAIVVRFLAAAFGRALTFLGAWKLSVAAQLPGSVLMAFALALYSSGQISVLFVVVMFAAHFLTTALYLLVSPLFLPKVEPTSAEKNPFESDSKKKPKKKNPFAGK